MAENKKKVEEITSMEEDFAKWYTDIVKKADLIDYSGVKGCMIIRPYGYAIWENIQSALDGMFKATGHCNVYMPMFIPESLLNKEKDHVEGFAPEVAWVTHGGSEKLTERLCVRPTSEVLFCAHYKDIIKSYRDLPKLYNQWCSVVRWEKTTRPFLRSREFLWQEGHTMHETAQEAHEETIRMLNVYADFCSDFLAIPVIKGKKTNKEKFAGAESTYSIEAMMHDGKSLQAGTSHDFGDGFAKAFEIQFLDKENKLQYCHQTSWGVSTRIIGAIIMVHGDDNGLRLPPRIAPTQLVIVPIASHKAGVLERAEELADSLRSRFRIELDDSDNSAGWKFSQHEMRGIPIRLELGPKDIEKGQCVLVRRDTGEKIFTSLDNIEESVEKLLEQIHEDMYNNAVERMNSMTYDATTFDELCEQGAKKNGFFRAMWCGSQDCEDMVKEKADMTSRNIPFDGEAISGKCVCCGESAKHLVYWGKAY